MRSFKSNRFSDIKEAFADMMSFRIDDNSSAALDAESNYATQLINAALETLSKREHRRLMRMIAKHQRIIAAEILRQ